MACVRPDVNAARSGISITAKKTQRRLEESQRAPRKGLLLSKCCYCLELPALSYTTMHTHRWTRTCTQTHVKTLTWHSVNFHTVPTHVLIIDTHMQMLPLLGFSHSTWTTDKCPHQYYRSSCVLILMFIRSRYIIAEFPKVWNTQRAGVLPPQASDTSEFAALVRMWCDPLSTPLKWPSWAKVQEEDYGFLPMTRLNPEGCHSRD